MRGLFLTVVGLAGAVVVVGVVLVALALAGSPRPTCADGPVATSRAAEDSFNSKWNGFDSAIRRGEAASVTFAEDELTSRGARYLQESNVPARNLQVHLCPGQGRGEAALTVDALGRAVDAVVAGHLDLSATPPRIVADSVRLGQVPEAIATLAANRLIEAANIQVPAFLREVSTTSAAATLRGRR